MLWNQNAQTDRTIPNNKPGAVIHDNKERNCACVRLCVCQKMLQFQEIENWSRKKLEKIEIQRTRNVNIEVKAVIIGETGTFSKSFRQYLSNAQGRHRIKELQTISYNWHCTHTAESSNVKVKNIISRNYITCTIICNYRTGVTVYTLATGLARKKIYLVLGIHCCPNFFTFILPYQRLYIVKNVCIFTYIWLLIDCVWITVATKQYREWNIFTQIGSGAKCWLDICHWGAGLAVTGRKRDFGQNVIQSSFQTGNSDSPSYCHRFYLTVFLEEAFIIKIIIILCVNYVIVICINNNNNNNNAVINSNWGRLQVLILLFKIPMATRRNFCEIYRLLGKNPKKGSPPCPRNVVYFSYILVNTLHRSDNK